ncbi:MAG: hypothetical protein LBF75_08730, partial [Treponema sp.]|nr:hypothetical protein [Treponema sp.]
MNVQRDDEVLHYIRTADPCEMKPLFTAAREVRAAHYGQDVYFQGIIEFSNHCGIRGQPPPGGHLGVPDNIRKADAD